MKLVVACLVVVVFVCLLDDALARPRGGRRGQGQGQGQGRGQGRGHGHGQPRGDGDGRPPRHRGGPDNDGGPRPPRPTGEPEDHTHDPDRPCRGPQCRKPPRGTEEPPVAPPEEP